MFYWWFMLVTCLLMPVLMIVFGYFFVKSPPRKINSVFGYRTKMSMKNMDTWVFAHSCFGRLWVRIGIVMLPVSIIAMLFFIGQDGDTAAYAGTIIVICQTILMMIPIAYTERKLRMYFDLNGDPK